MWCVIMDIHGVIPQKFGLRVIVLGSVFSECDFWVTEQLPDYPISEADHNNRTVFVPLPLHSSKKTKFSTGFFRN